MNKSKQSKFSNLIDTNLIIRFLTADDRQKASAVKRLLSSGKIFFLPDIAFAEIIWVLSSYYGFERIEIYSKMKSLLAFEKVNCDRILLSKAVENYYNFKHLSFVDSYLVALIQIQKSEVLYSYDKGFDKVASITRVEP